MQLKDAQLFRQQAYIDGAWVDADGGQTIKVNNPATGEIIGSVPKMGAAETRRAIEAADKALPAWRALTAKERAGKLRRWFELLIENQDDLGRLMTLEQGKPLAEAKGEIAYAASFIEWFAEEAKRVYGDVIPGHQPDKRLIVIKQPIGVTAAITPWNFPAAMITRKAGPALAAHGPPVQHHVVAHLDVGDGLADLGDAAGGLMSEQEGELVVDAAVAVGEVRVAHPAGLDVDHYVGGAGVGDHDVHQLRRLLLRSGDDALHGPGHGVLLAPRCEGRGCPH